MGRCCIINYRKEFERLGQTPPPIILPYEHLWAARNIVSDNVDGIVVHGVDDDGSTWILTDAEVWANLQWLATQHAGDANEEDEEEGEGEHENEDEDHDPFDDAPHGIDDRPGGDFDDDSDD